VNESKIDKIELSNLLYREGRAKEAFAYKEEIRKQLRSEGMGRSEAVEEAWRRMAAQYPPLEIIGESGPNAPEATIAKPSMEQDIDVDALLERFRDGQPSDLTKDTLWTYENLENKRVKASDAPSCGVWALLKWAKEYRNRFFEQVLPKAMLNKPPEDEDNIRQEKRALKNWSVFWIKCWRG